MGRPKSNMLSTFVHPAPRMRVCVLEIWTQINVQYIFISVLPNNWNVLEMKTLTLRTCERTEHVIRSCFRFNGNICAQQQQQHEQCVCAVCGWVCCLCGRCGISNARQCFYSVNRKILLGIFSVIINSCERMRSSWWNRSDCVRLRPNWAKPSDVIHQFGSPTPLCDSWAQKSLAISRSLEEIGIAA